MGSEPSDLGPGSVASFEEGSVEFQELDSLGSGVGPWGGVGSGAGTGQSGKHIVTVNPGHCDSSPHNIGMLAPWNKGAGLGRVSSSPSNSLAPFPILTIMGSLGM